MSSHATDFSLSLFVPADRPERFAKALCAGADCVIIDLEDAVAAPNKAGARAVLSKALSEMEGGGATVVVRINALGTSWHDDDLAMLRQQRIAGLMVPKVESSAGLRLVREALGRDIPLIALIESAAGLVAARDIAGAAHQLAFGSIDFAADIGCAHSREALLLARSELVIASRAAGRPQPIDGVTTSIRDEGLVEDDARYASSLGFGGKLLIHPAQIAAARRGMAPSQNEVDWARRIIDASAGTAAVAIDGFMVDAPVLARAENILRRQFIQQEEALGHDQDH